MVPDAVLGSTEAVYAPTLAEARDAALARVRPGDMLMTVGAGDVTSLGQELVRSVQNLPPDGAAPDGAPRTP